MIASVSHHNEQNYDILYIFNILFTGQYDEMLTGKRGVKQLEELYEILGRHDAFNV